RRPGSGPSSPGSSPRTPPACACTSGPGSGSWASGSGSAVTTAAGATWSCWSAAAPAWAPADRRPAGRQPGRAGAGPGPGPRGWQTVLRAASATPGTQTGANDEGSPLPPVRGAGGPGDRGSPRSASGSRPGPDYGTRGRRQPERLEEAPGPDGWGAPADS